MQKPFLQRLVAALLHQWPIVITIVALGFVGAFGAARAQHPKYVSSTYVLMVSGSSDAPSSQGPASPSQPVAAADLPALATAATVLRRVRQDVHATIPVDSMKTRIKAKVSSLSTIMELDYTGDTPDAAIAGANAVGNETTRFYRELATRRFDALISDLKTQLGQRRAELASLDGDLADISKSYPYIDAKSPGADESGAGSVYSRLIGLRTARDDLQASLRADIASARAARGLIANATPLAMHEIVQNDILYSRLRDQYAKDESELKRISAYGSASFPGLVELRRTVARDEAAAEAARRQALKIGPATNVVYASALDAVTHADAQVASDEAKVAEENQALQALHAQIGRRSIATTAARMRRDHDNAEAAYSIIASRLANSIADRAQAASTGSLVILEPAQFASKASAGSASVVAFGLVFLSIWLALTVAVMLDNGQEWFNDARTIETVYGAPVIGSLA